MKFDRYFYVARATPAIYCALPVLVTYYFFIRWVSPYFFNTIEDLRFYGSIPVATVLIFLMGMLGRFIGKEWFEDRLYKSRTDFPTTRLLMSSDKVLSDVYKQKIYSKVFFDFQIPIGGKKVDTQRISDAVGLIRNSVRGDKLVLQYNAQYGLIRNLIGGCTVGIIFSLLNLILAYYLKHTSALYVSLIFFSAMLLPLIFSRQLIEHHANDYARALFDAYLSK